MRTSFGSRSSRLCRCSLRRCPARAERRGALARCVLHVLFHVSPGVPFHVPPGQVPADSISPDAQIVVGNYIGSGGQYMAIQGDIEKFVFKKELHSGQRHTQYTIRRDSICVDLDITASSPFRVKKLNKREMARVKSDLLVTYRKWESDRAKQLAIGSLARVHICHVAKINDVERVSKMASPISKRFISKL